MYPHKVTATAGTGTERRRLPRALREQQMLDAAVEVFSEYGFHAASMEQIAERARVSKPLLYLYLGSKEETFRACIARETDRLVDALGTAARAPAADEAERLWRGLTAFFSYVAERRSSWAVLYQQARTHNESVAAHLSRVRGEIVATVADLVLQAMRTRTPQHGGPGYAAMRREATAVSRALVGAADAMADWAVTNPNEDPQTTARRLMNLMWLGMERTARGERFTGPAADARDSPE
jgi:AcrR family transcriptional regulator